jgi:hypothetical protein
MAQAVTLIDGVPGMLKLRVWTSPQRMSLCMPCEAFLHFSIYLPPRRNVWRSGGFKNRTKLLPTAQRMPRTGRLQGLSDCIHASFGPQEEPASLGVAGAMSG